MGLALQAFDRLVKEGISLSPDLFGTLMYIFAGGDEWEATARLHTHRTGPSSLLFPPELTDVSPPYLNLVGPSPFSGRRVEQIIASTDLPTLFNSLCYWW